VLDQEGDKPAEEWCAFLGPAELDGVEGTCLIELGEPARAAQLLERAVAAYSDRYARNRALYRVRLARARLDLKAVDGAAEAATAALDDLSRQVASWRVHTELAAVGERLASYPREPSAEQFIHRYRAPKD
jgi:hypothetical protein